MLNILFAIIPSIIFIGLFLFLNKNLTKKKIIKYIIILIIGSIGSYICYRLEMHYGSYFKKVKDSTYLEVLFYAIFGVAIFEEGYKWFVPTIITIKEKMISAFDLLSYYVFSSIGFALSENVIFYAIPYGLSTSIRRMFTAFPSHICDALCMSLFMYLFTNNKGIKKYIFFCFSLIVPIFVHALYNSFLYGKDSSLLIYHYIYCVILYIISIIILIYFYRKQKVD